MHVLTRHQKVALDNQKDYIYKAGLGETPDLLNPMSDRFNKSKAD